MGYYSGIGQCYGCGRMFSFNPEKVPSYQGEPICRDCIERVNEIRKDKGLPLWPILPGAYEPQAEGVGDEGYDDY